MVHTINAGPAGDYETVAAGQTDQVLGPTSTGAIGDYLEGITIIAATVAPGAVTVKDNTTVIFSSPAGTATVLPYIQYVPFRVYSKVGAFTVTTGSNVSVLCVGKFT